MFRVTRYPMISKTEMGWVGYRKKYRVAGRVRVPAGHCQYANDERLSSSAILVDKMDFLTSFSWFLVLFSLVVIKIPRFLSEFLSLCFFVNNSVPAGPTSPFSFCETSEEIYITVHQPKSLLWHLSSIPILFLPKGEQTKNCAFSFLKKHNIFLSTIL